ncbi:MAG: 1-acyl-sn-glycerol-3-phosphate acyltransferase [Chloroflexota bacterium]|nr:1-acyl-sn-glycerol-3-phosphate acyltransferase [Chloroflexota bacterium]
MMNQICQFPEPVADFPVASEDYHRGTLRGWPRAVVRWFLLQAIRPFIKLTIDGLESVPRSGSFLFIANHLHNADPILLETAITRPVHFMAKKELFRSRLLASGLRLVGAFPVDRGRPDRAAIRRAEALLSHGIAVGMFPEGTRSKTGQLQPAFPGAGLIAVRSGMLILPACIAGTERLPLNGLKAQGRLTVAGPPFRRHEVTIRFGAPFALADDPAGGRMSAARATEQMMIEIARLLPEPYRGMYGNLITPPTSSGVEKSTTSTI